VKVFPGRPRSLECIGAERQPATRKRHPLKFAVCRRLTYNRQLFIKGPTNGRRQACRKDRTLWITTARWACVRLSSAYSPRSGAKWVSTNVNCAGSGSL
jgi:hypothetical protein